MKTFTVALVLLLVTGLQGAAIPEDNSLKKFSTEWRRPFWDLSKIVFEIYDIAIKKLYLPTLYKIAVTNIDNYWKDLAITSAFGIGIWANKLTSQKFFYAQYIRDRLDTLKVMLNFVGEELYEELGSEAFTKIHETLVSTHECIKQLRRINESQHHRSNDTQHHLL
ncbi:uncharacterized protein LOC144608707 [Rhinoraja longicauda]